MQLNATEFKWNGKRAKAAELVAQDVLSDSEIADHLKINKATLERWKKHPDFAAQVEASVTALADEIRKEGIANKQNRIDSYVSDFELTTKLMQARAADTATKRGPGGDTGLVVRSVKGIGGGEDFQVVETFEFDAALISARQQLRRQLAEELGQLQDNVNITGSLRREYVVVRESDHPTSSPPEVMP